MRDAYIVTAIRTPGCKKNKGAFKDTRPEDLLSFILKKAVEMTPNLEKKDIDDVMIGCTFPEAEHGLNIGRISAQMAGFPDEVSGATINRFCASGLEAIALTGMRIMTGWSDIAIAGGIESMTYVPMPGNVVRPHPDYSKTHANLYISMGNTAEILANRYQISRLEQDEFAFHSHQKAAEASAKNLFREIVPTPAVKYIKNYDGTYKKETYLVSGDDGIRADTTVESLAKLNPAFAVKGSVTAGNSSQMTDGAGAVVMMSENRVRELSAKPIARLKCYTTIGCRPEEMGVGPKYAIPKLMKLAGIDLKEIGLFEINEAFACQAVYCIRELGIDPSKVNVHGGAIALGHPMGCTGAKLCATLLSNMQQYGIKYGIESMCVGGGMGAAALFELCD